MKKKVGKASGKKHRGWFVFIATLVLLSFFVFTLSLDVLYRAGATAFWLVAFYALDRWFKLEFRFVHYIIVLAMSVVSNLLFPLYFVWPQYDKVLHFTLPFLYAVLIFHLVDKHDLPLKWKLFFTFFIVLGTNALFEIAEFLLDQVTDLKLQGVYQWQSDGGGDFSKLALILDKNTDTMIDMMLGVVGTLIFVIITPFVRRKRS